MHSKLIICGIFFVEAITELLPPGSFNSTLQILNQSEGKFRLGLCLCVSVLINRVSGISKNKQAHY